MIDSDDVLLLKQMSGAPELTHGGDAGGYVLVVHRSRQRRRSRIGARRIAVATSPLPQMWPNLPRTRSPRCRYRWCCGPMRRQLTVIVPFICWGWYSQWNS